MNDLGQEDTIEELQKQVRFLHHELQKVENSRYWRFRKYLVGIRNLVTDPKHYLRKIKVIKYKLKFFLNGKPLSYKLEPILKHINLFIPKNNPNNYDPNLQEELYQDWIRRVEMPRRARDYENIEEKINQLEYKPKFSVILPTYNSDEIYLRQCVFSVINQYYPNWELCIADDNSTKKIIKPLLESFKQRDSRVKVTYRTENGNISQGTNSAVEIAEGEFLVLLDHDDEIAPEALYELAVKLNEDKNYDFIYSDNDKIDIYGHRSGAKFKPDWSPDLFLSHSYTSHIKCLRTRIFRELGGFDSEFDGSQDFEFLLRFFEKTDKVGHIPQILYHWRAVPGSTAVSAKEKPESLIRGQKAVQRAIERRGIQGEAAMPFFADHSNLGIFKVNFDPAQNNQRVTIMIPTKDKVDLLKRNIDSIRKRTNYDNYDILVLNNNSEQQETFDYLKSNNIKYIDIPTSEFNFSYINNEGAKHAEGEYILLLNNDIEVMEPDWLLEMVGALNMDPKIGAVGAKLIYSDGRIQHNGVVMGLDRDVSSSHANKLLDFDSHGYLNYNNVIKNYTAVTAACLLTRKDLYLEVGGMDDENLKVTYNDVDYCIKLIDKGYRVITNPYALLYHHEGQSRGKNNDDPREWQFLYNKWKKYIDNDRYYNINLAKHNERFEIKTRE
ncbi:glycosyltransferase family 2 protein [Candidatus Dojkabacteria bacterium]|uniref:Glycosyltransferase family 2 protein n=1 Tax=Candidatus Dojkabacteria bacterium TaxID=2099670 RepID=A0A955L5J1_9BACT|nr:glycosyltransferase family 2 protein [Candidatus Dojkabacteria bacterium]